jgi:hypothetical protein
MSFAAPAGRSHAHAVPDGALKGSIGLVPCCLCHSTGGGGRSSQLQGCLGHPDVRQQIAG